MITEITKRNIFDELRANDSRVVFWYGRLDEIKFLKRIYKLNELPSTDSRYVDMAGDIFKHRVANYDWDDWWIVDDDRLELFTNDEIFLKFLCEMLHPVVRKDSEELEYLLDIFNRYLSQDGLEIIPDKKISGKSVFKAVRIGMNSIEVENKEKFTREFAIEQLEKCENKVKDDDYDGAITNARSLVEDVFADIYSIVTGNELEKSGDLRDDYKSIKNLLNLAPEKHTNDSIKQITRSFSTIIEGIDRLSNQMGDRHRRLVKPERHHAKICVNSAKVIVDFLYDTLDFQTKRKEFLIKTLMSILDGHKSKGVLRYETYSNYIRSLSREELLQEEKVKLFIKSLDSFQKRLIIDELINKFEIKSWVDSSRFFGAMYIVFDCLNACDVERITKRFINIDQAVGLAPFLDVVKSQKAESLYTGD